MRKKLREKKSKVLIINGPNLHLLGRRERDIYGTFTLADLKNDLNTMIKKSSASLEMFQSNSEGEIVEKITKAKYNFLIINPAAYTHTSVAIRDAILARGIPTIEVHISNIYRREEFRKKSLISDVVIGTINGLGKYSYLLALRAALAHLGTSLKENL